MLKTQIQGAAEMQEPENQILVPNKEFPISIMTETVCESSHLPGSRLGFSDHIEISVVIEGEGFHKILNETSECHAGDM